MTIKRLNLTALFLTVALLPFAADVRASEPLDDMADAANALLAALEDDQKEKATFAWESDERVNWHFIPRERLGLPLMEMREDQRELAHALLATGMSRRGYIKAMNVMSLERVLWELENQAPHRLSGNYLFSIFGTPTAGGTWGWRCEGHHMSLNFTIVDGKLFSGSPSFYGTNPGEIRQGPRKGFKVLSVEEDLARELANSLSSSQRAKAVVADKAPADIITSADRTARVLEPMGIAIGDLNGEQREMLVELTKEYMFRTHEHFAELEWAKLGDRPALHFAWAGGMKPGEGHYYRIQGPGFLIEYDNVQNGCCQQPRQPRSRRLPGSEERFR